MITLALEFSGNIRSVAILATTADGAANLLGEAMDAGNRSLRPLALIQKALDAAGLKRGEITSVAVGLGPGSYTGIRAALSLGQGWQLATQVGLVGIGSADAISWQIQQQGVRGRVRIAIDAQRDEFYVQSLDIAEDKITVIEELALQSREGLNSLLEDEVLLFGPKLSGKFPSAHDLEPGASAIGQLAALRRGFKLEEPLEPIYLRATTFIKAPLPRCIP